VSFLCAKEHIYFREGFRMEQKDLMGFVEAQGMDDLVPAEKAGRIILVDIDKIEKHTDKFTKDDKEISVNRYLLTMKDKRKIRMPCSAMKQLNELMKQQQIVAFTVMKTGQELNTKYSIAPELMR
jgi:hypothetical protein